MDVGRRGSFLREQPGTPAPPQRCAPGPHLQDVRRRNSPACPFRAKAQSMGRVKIWFTSTSYSQGLLRDRGYFGASVSFEERMGCNPKKAKIGYVVNAGQLHTFYRNFFTRFLESSDIFNKTS